MKSKVKVLLSIASTTAGVGLLALYFVGLPKPDLMRHASRIQGSMAWGIYRENWNWLNSRELLYVPAMPADSEGLQEVRRADRSSGRVDRLPALNTNPRGSELQYPFRFVSPDAKWVLRYYVPESGPF